jgi:hypothetical protein
MDMNAARISAPWTGRYDVVLHHKDRRYRPGNRFSAQASRRSTTNAVTAMSAAVRTRKMPVSMPWNVQ